MCPANKPPELFGDLEGESTAISVPAVRKVKLEPVAPRLDLVAGPGAPQTFVLSQPELTIGRGEACEIRIDVQELSRLHAKVTHHDGIVHIQDLQSRNGVLLNAVKVSAARLSQGDQIQLGPVVLVFHEGSL